MRKPAAAEEPDDGHRARSQPVREGGEPGGAHLPRHRPARDPRPERLHVAARRLRRRRTPPATRPTCCRPTPRRTPPSPTPRSTASPRPRTTRSPWAATSSTPHPPPPRRPDRGRGVRLGPHRGRRRGPRPLVRPARHRDPDHRGHRRGPRGRASGLGRLRAAATSSSSSRPARSSRASSRTATPPCRRPTTGSWPPSLTARWRYERTTSGDDWNESYDDIRAILLERVREPPTAGRCRRRCYVDGPGRPRGASRGRRDQVLGAQQAPLPGRPRRRSAWRTTARSSSPPTGRTA